MNFEISFPIGDDSGSFDSRSSGSDLGSVAWKPFDPDAERTSGNLAASELHDDLVLTGHRRHVDAVVRQVSVVVEYDFTLKPAKTNI